LQTSEFLARLIGPIFLVMGIGMLIDARGYRATAMRFLESRALILIAGVLTLLAGLAIVNAHNVWAADWRAIITMIGWLAVVVGVFRILFPQKVTRIGNAMVASQNYLVGAAIVFIALGAILSFFGYIR
jgi:hypothetical protein